MSRFVTVLFSILILCGISSLSFGQAVYDTVSIYDIQWVPDPGTDDTSPLLGDTVVVRALVMHGPNDLYIGARLSTFIVDPDSFPKPWSGLLIVQHDSTISATEFDLVEPGDICYFTGIVEAYYSYTQLVLLDGSKSGRGDQAVPVTFESFGNELPDPVKLTSADLSTYADGEQWENMYAIVENVTIVNNSTSSNTASFTDGSSGTAYLDDYFLYFRSRFDNETFQWPVAGTRLTATGFVRDTGQPFSINPETEDDLIILTNPPVLSDLTRNPGVPGSADDVVVSATITDNGVVDSAAVLYSVDWAPFTSLKMTAEVDTFSATIPKQADGAYVRYFIYADDDENDWTTLPGDTSSAMYSYVVRDGVLSIMDVQYTWGYLNDASPYNGFEVTLLGVVTTDSGDYGGGYYYIQDKDSMWSGIMVRDGDNKFIRGDKIEIRATVQENYGLTRLNYVESATKLSSDNAFSPVHVTTDEINTGGTNSEAYESVFITTKVLTVSNPFPDGSGNYGEIEIDDGSGGVRVDDYSSYWRGNLDTTYHQDDTIEELRGPLYYSYNNFKIIPRDSNDVIGHVTAIDRITNATPNQFNLAQNYPNPFNPVTQIEYSIAKTGQYSMIVYNVLGQKVRTLFNEYRTAGAHQMTWNGLDEHNLKVGTGIYFYVLQGEGQRITRKMIMLK